VATPTAIYQNNYLNCAKLHVDCCFASRSRWILDIGIVRLIVVRHYPITIDNTTIYPMPSATRSPYVPLFYLFFYQLSYSWHQNLAVAQLTDEGL
jgi:hypothetical protein